jgi:hypothetical protein
MQQQNFDSNLNRLIGLTMTQKENLISEFEKELTLERQRREEMFEQF